MGQFTLGVLLIGAVVGITSLELARWRGASERRSFWIGVGTSAVTIFVLSLPIGGWLVALAR